MTFEVDTSSLNSTVKNMESELNSIIQISSRLYSALNALDGMWVGAAHDTFEAQYLEDQKMLADMNKTISNVIEGMESARNTYNQCEQSVKMEIKKIAV